MNIITKLTPNNKFQIKRYRVADGYGRAKRSDDSSDLRDTLQHAKIQQLYEDRIKVLNAHTTLATQKVYKECFLEKSLPLPGFEEGRKLTKVSQEIEVKRISDSIEYVSTSPGDNAVVIRETKEEFLQRNSATLDFLKKSQQQLPKHCSWGLKQRPKVFRSQAGEKIKAGGAVIDRFCGLGNTSMLTLTLPGGAWQALDAVSRWSGWIVNRILQVVRRQKDSENPIYWFFVWEHQKRGALHLHFCLGWKVSQEKRELLGKEMKAKWFGCLLEIYDKEKIDCFARKGFQGSWRDKPEKWQWDYQEVRKSVAAYFAKYCKKNASLSGKAKKRTVRPDEGGGSSSSGLSKRKYIHYPSRYWGSSKTVKDWCKYLTRQQKYVAVSEETASEVCGRIRDAAVVGRDFVSVSVSQFEVIEPRTGICISSGTIETYCVSPELYANYWVDIAENLFELDVRMDAKCQQFMQT